MGGNQEMDILKQFMELGGVIVGAGLFLVFLILAFLVVRTFYRICSPNEVLVFSGGFQKSFAGGKRQNFETLTGGRKFYIPGLTNVSKLSLNLMEVPIQVRNSYSQGGIAMNVDAIANVKISSDREVIGNAVERFLNQDIANIRRVAKETLEGHLRGVIANLTPEQVNEDRLLFADSLARETEEDLRKLGLHLDTLKILHVSDEVGYLDATGRKAIAAVVRSAEIAESDANRAAELTEAENRGRGDVMTADADKAIVELRNELRRMKAELESEVLAEEERTMAAAREARATAEQHLQQVRAELEGIRLQADQVLPAQAQQEAAGYIARGEAALIRERGRAASESLALLADSWRASGGAATQIALIEDIEKLIRAASQGVQKLQIEKISVIDGGDGRTLTNYISAYPQMLSSVFDAVQQTTGLDISETIAGKHNFAEEKNS
jgi:flotillin